MMIESIEFKNFKALRDTKLPLGQFTLIVGPNGSGKSTVLQALQCVGNQNLARYTDLVTVGVASAEHPELRLTWAGKLAGATTIAFWGRDGESGRSHEAPTREPLVERDKVQLSGWLERACFYSLDAHAVGAGVRLDPNMVLQANGHGLAGVIDRLRDDEPERFASLNDEIRRWLPEFDAVLFDTPGSGSRAVALRTSDGHHKITAPDLSQGTLLALAILTIAYLPQLPPLVGFEEPDRGLHPRLLVDVRDALYRLAYPDRFGEKRDPVQVIATTHNPYFLSLFKDHPEEIVIAEKVGQEAKFVRLADHPDIDEILRDGDLGEVWYSGVLGGVPAER